MIVNIHATQNPSGRFLYIQNALARTTTIFAVFRCSNLDNILKLLHWFKVEKRIEYKSIFTIV